MSSHLFERLRTLQVLGLAAILVVGLATGCTSTPDTDAGTGMVSQTATTESDTVRLTLLTTHDFHGALISKRKDRETRRPIGGAAAVAAVIQQGRETNPEGTLVLDAGDSFHGTALSNLTEGKATIDFMNLVGFDATALGNHGFDWGTSVLLERMEQANFPFLVANIHDKKSGQPPSWAQPYHVVERLGLRIALIGLVTTSTPRTTLPENVASLEFLPPAPVANRLIEELVPAKADLAILLTHIGLRVSDDGQPQGELIDTMAEVQGAAAVIGGHSHQVFAGTLNGVPVVQAGANGLYLGHIELEVDRKTHRVLQSKARTQQIFADTQPPHAAVAKLVEGYQEKFEAAMQEVLGQASVPIKWHGDRECAMGNLFADAIRKQIGADFLFQNPLGLRASWEAGPITREDVYRVMPFDNTVVLMAMTGTEILELLEQSVDTVRLFYISGLRYEVDKSKPVGSRITTTPALDPDRTYEVSVNNFLAQGGDGLSLLANRNDARDVGALLRDVWIDWIEEETRQGRAITAAVDGRIKIE